MAGIDGDIVALDGGDGDDLNDRRRARLEQVQLRRFAEHGSPEDVYFEARLPWVWAFAMLTAGASISDADVDSTERLARIIDSTTSCS